MTKHKNNFFTDGSKIDGDLKHCAYAIFKNDRNKKTDVIERDLNVYEIEGLAVLECLKLVPKKSRIFCDNKQVVDELNDLQEPKDREWYNECKELMKEKGTKIRKVPRDQNHAGRYLEKRLSKVKKNINGKYKKINLKKRIKEGVNNGNTT